MGNELSYWYDGWGSANFASDLPAQAIPSRAKNDKWKRATLDALERVGLKQYRENIRFADYYRMSEGKVSHREVADIIPQLREVSGLLDKINIPTSLQHYDLLGIIVNYLQSVMVANKDKFYPTETGEIYSNERTRKLNELLHDYILQEWNKELNLKLIEAGLDPSRSVFASPEEQQAYQEQINQATKSLTPPEIATYMEKGWKSAGVQWATATLEQDEKRFRLNELDRDCIYDYLHTGRCFQHYYVKYDTYDVEKWGTINTFFSQTVDSKYPQYGEYIGRVHFYTPSDFINKKGYHFTEKQKRLILNNSDADSFEGSSLRFEGALERNFQSRYIVPFENYFDYNFMLDLQEQTGIPLAERTVHRKDGTVDTFRDFLPKSQHRNSNVSRYARYLREDLNLRTDMIMVTEAYWRSYQKVGLLTYVKPDGTVETEIVTDEIIGDFLEENGIKQIRDISLEEAIKKKSPNTIVWDYKPEIWQGEKATTSSTNLHEDLYYNVKPLEYQIKGNSNNFDLQLPVAGIIDKNPADKIMPWQFLYNIACNKQRDMHEKELGVFMLFDINYLPADIKGYGDTQTSLLHMMRAVKDSGMFGVDTSKTNSPQGANFNQFSVEDASLSKQIQENQVLAEHYKNKAFEQFGLTPQSLGEVVKYATKGGVDQAAESTRTQTDYLYDAFSAFKERALLIHLSLAQWAQGEYKDTTIEYTKSDLSNAFLRISKEQKIALRDLGIMSISDAKSRREMEMLKQYMLSTNTQQNDSLLLADIVGSDSFLALREIASLERQRQDIIREQQMLHEQQLQQQALKAQQEAEVRTWTLKERTEEANRQNKIELERLKALGRSADNNATPGALEILSFEADNSLAREQANNDLNTKLKEIDLKLESEKNRYKLGAEQLALKARELDIKEKDIETRKYESEINKN